MPEESKKYGILMYDVPTTNMALYNRIWKAIRARAIKLNHSVYLLKWGHRMRMQQLIDEAVAETGQNLVAKFMKFDEAEQDNVENIAKEALRRDISEIVQRIRKKVDDATADQEDVKDIPDLYWKKQNKLLKQVAALAVMFGFEQDIDGVLEQAKSLVEVQWNGARRRRQS